MRLGKKAEPHHECRFRFRLIFGRNRKQPKLVYLQKLSETKQKLRMVIRNNAIKTVWQATYLHFE